MKFLFASTLLAVATAYPGVSSDNDILNEASNIFDERGIAPPHACVPHTSSASESNSGLCDSKQFDAADQYVDVRPGSGNEFRAPVKGEVRGPCPGLNAAANHAFASRSGVFNYKDTTNGLFNAFALGKDFSNILFVFSVFNSGSAIDMAWSIGGPMKTTTLGILGKGLGLSNSHNKYEGDSSPGRGDAFLHNGDAHTLNIPNYMNLLQKAHAGGNDYNMAQMRKHIVFTHEFTKQNNPYGFFGPGFFVSPIAHEFVTNFMSNHSKESVGGYLPEHILNSFFAVKKSKSGVYEWMPGMDRIPDNWYRRPSNNPYGIFSAVGDFQLTVLENPEIAEIGGNMGKAGDYVGLDIGDLTNGVFNAKDLTKGNNLSCFALQFLTIATPGVLEKLTNGGGVTPFGKLTNKVLGGTFSKLQCPQLSAQSYNLPMLTKYPGYNKKQALQPATPY